MNCCPNSKARTATMACPTASSASTRCTRRATLRRPQARGAGRTSVGASCDPLGRARSGRA
jgi:hypothetical protein